MASMTITDFRQHLGDAIERVEAGEVIEITRNNRTIAELRSKRGASNVEWNKANVELKQLIDEGIRLGGGPYSEDDKYGDAQL